MAVRLRPEAEADVSDAVAWYEAHEAGLGGKFLAAVADAMVLIMQHPHAGQDLGTGARRILVPRFPYSLTYVAGTDAIVIVACFHFRRDPLSWRERLR